MDTWVKPAYAPFFAGYRLICAFNVSSTTRSKDDAFGGALSRCSATNLSRFATSAESFWFNALRCFICLSSSSMRCSGFSARRGNGGRPRQGGERERECADGDGRLHGSPPAVRPSEPGFPSLRVPVRSKTARGADKFTADPV